MAGAASGPAASGLEVGLGHAAASHRNGQTGLEAGLEVGPSRSPSRRRASNQAGPPGPGPPAGGGTEPRLPRCTSGRGLPGSDADPNDSSAARRARARSRLTRMRGCVPRPAATAGSQGLPRRHCPRGGGGGCARRVTNSGPGCWASGRRRRLPPDSFGEPSISRRVACIAAYMQVNHEPTSPHRHTLLAAPALKAPLSSS